MLAYVYNVLEGNGNPLQHSCLENPMGRGAGWATVHGVTKRVRQDVVTEHMVFCTFCCWFLFLNLAFYL